MPHPAQDWSAAKAGTPAPDEIRAALGRVLASPGLTSSNRRRDFLRFVVEEALAGRAPGLKGIVIAREVYGRDEDFSGKSDPVVRLDAGRLRRDLDSYYVGPGALDAIRIVIPKGGYAPLFEIRDDVPATPEDAVPDGTTAPPPQVFPSGPPAPGPDASGSGAPVPPAPAPGPAAGSGRQRLRLAGALLVVAVALVAVWLLRGEGTGGDPLDARGLPRVVVLPFTALTTAQETRVVAAGLGMELVDDLRHFGGLRIYLPPDGPDAELAADRLRDAPGAIYVVRGTVRAEGGQVQINTTLGNLRTDEVIWSAAYAVALAPAPLLDLRDTVAARIATALGQPYGPIGMDLAQRGPGTRPASVESYLCVLEAYQHRRAFSPATYGPAVACLEAAVARDPDYGDAWAMLGWLHLDAGRFEYAGAAPVETEYARALEAARRAQAIAPDSVLALKALSSIQHYLGRYDESERLARRAVALNPYDPDTLAQLGWRLAMRGKFDEGVPLLQEAVDRSVNPPDWYFHMIAASAMMRGDYAAMRREADRAALSGRPIAETLLAIAAGGEGDRAAARAALARLPPGWDAARYVRRHGGTEEIVAAVEAGLARARRVAAAPSP